VLSHATHPATYAASIRCCASSASLGPVTSRPLKGLRKRLAAQEVGLELSPAATAWLAEAGHDPVYGARPLARALKRHLETPLGRALISGKVGPGQTAVIDVRDGGLVVDVR
jgi:ATP-dependent Clp protease ATP-binding subunit ClpB